MSVGVRTRHIKFDENGIDSVFANLNQCQLPGVAVGIAIGGRPVYRRGFGLASMELPVALLPSTRMRIGSTSKHFTALAYLLLCEESRAGIDDPVGKHLPELHPVCRDITMRQLMANTGGHRDVHDIAWTFSGTGKVVSSSELLALYRHIDDVNAPAGTVWNYNNGGWLMLSTAVERIADRSLEEFLRDRIFAPLGMHDTLLRRIDTDFVPNSATLHMPSVDADYRQWHGNFATRAVLGSGAFEKSYLGTALAGEGGIVSSVDDMLKWLAHMDHPFVGRSDTWAAIKTPQALANGSSTSYGLGLMVGQYRGVGVLHHGGGVMGGGAQMLKVPEASLDVIVLTNRGDVNCSLLVDQILDVCLEGLEPPPGDISITPAEGTFRSPTTGRIVQLFLNDGRQIASIDGFDVAVKADSNGVLWPTGVFQYMKLGIAGVGWDSAPKSITLSDFGNRDVLFLAPPCTNCAWMLGRYQSKATGTEAVIEDQRGRVALKMLGRFGSVNYRLEAIGEGVCRATTPLVLPPGGVLTLQPSEDGFRFSTFRTRALPFRRVN